MTGDDVLAAAERCRATMEPSLAADWAVPVPGLDFTVASVVAYAAEASLWYPQRAPARQRGGVRACPRRRRGRRPGRYPGLPSLRVGRATAAFAAMACDELLVHGDDAARGLGLVFVPHRSLASAVLARLFPWHAVGPGEDPWRVLLWANGRIDLEGRPRQAGWRWQCAPLSEWDGTQP